MHQKILIQSISSGETYKTRSQNYLECLKRGSITKSVRFALQMNLIHSELL